MILQPPGEHANRNTRAETDEIHGISTVNNSGEWKQTLLEQNSETELARGLCAMLLDSNDLIIVVRDGGQKEGRGPFG